MAGDEIDGVTNTVEFIDLSGQGLTCTQPKSLPHRMYQHFGITNENRPVACSGNQYDGSGRDCWKYDPLQDDWIQMAPMSEERRSGAAVQMDYETFVVLGKNLQLLKNTEEVKINFWYIISRIW